VSCSLLSVQVVELDVQAVLAFEDGQRVVQASCVLGQRALSLHPSPFVV
jgi:hypothetical protein